MEMVLSVIKDIPITRVSNLTPLDRIGIPVWSACTPLSYDLTTHLGKGLTHIEAKLSSLMEAIERVSAEKYQPVEIYTSAIQLISDGLNVPQSLFSRHLDSVHLLESQEIKWSTGKDISSDIVIQYPTDFIISPPRGELTKMPDTNGLASGNSVLEATVHALGEIIERDIIGQHFFVESLLSAVKSRLPVHRIDIDSLPKNIQSLVEKILNSDLNIIIDYLPNDIGIPVFSAKIIDLAFPHGSERKPRTFFGFGAGTSSQLAVQRAITEAVQSRMAVIQGSRDTFNKLPSTGRLLSWCKDIISQPQLPFTCVPNFNSFDLEADLKFLIESLKRVGLSSVYVFDLTNSSFKIPVVRVRVPGLSNFLSNPANPGYRCWRHAL